MVESRFSSHSEAGETPENKLMVGRVLLGEGMQNGIEPPEEYEEGVLLKGVVHQIFSAAGMGKSWIALWLVKNAIERGERVLYMDMENGQRIISERLGLLGVEADSVDEYLTYLPSPSLTDSHEDVEAWNDLLSELRPELIVFDSWAGFLAAAGMEENSNDDVVRWSVLFTRPARKMGITTVVLDHVPHDAQRSRGASRKKDEADVQWQLVQSKPFYRDSVGEIVMLCKKDRQSWLPSSIKFSIGGGDEGFVCQRSEGTVEVPGRDGLTTPMRKAFEALVSTFGVDGAGTAAWQKAAQERGISRSTFYRVKPHLEAKGLIVNMDGRYRPLTLMGGEDETSGDTE